MEAEVAMNGRLSHEDKITEPIFLRELECGIPAHTIWVRNQGQHGPGDGLTTWMDTQCNDKHTALRPPDSISSSWSLFSGVSSSLVIVHRGGNIEEIDNSTHSSGYPGPGYLSGKALKWLGEKVIKALEDSVIVNRTHRHMAWLRQLERHKMNDMGQKERKRLFEVLKDALEMSRPFYSSWINRLGNGLGNTVDTWVKSALLRSDAKAAPSWVRMLRISASPLYLASFVDNPHDEELISRLRDCLTKSPLAVQDTEESTSSVIRLISHELASSRYSINHELYGEHLARIIHMTMKARTLTVDERNAIREIARRRLTQDDNEKDFLEYCRPWEVVVFAECAGQDPILAEVAKGYCGTQILLTALAALLRSDDAPPQVELEVMERMVWVLRHLLGRRHVWLVGELDPMVMHLLINVLSRTISQPGVLLACWTLDTIQNVIAHQPEMLQVLMDEDCIAILQHFASTRSLGPGDASSFFDQRRMSTASSAMKLLEAMHCDVQGAGNHFDESLHGFPWGEKPPEPFDGFGFGKRNFSLKGLYV